MNLATYLEGRHGAQTELARKLGCPPQLVWQWARGIRPIPIERCVPIEQATDGAVTRRDTRPDDWRQIWPELPEGDERVAAGESHDRRAADVDAPLPREPGEDRRHDPDRRADARAATQPMSTEALAAAITANAPALAHALAPAVADAIAPAIVADAPALAAELKIALAPKPKKTEG